MYWISGLVEIQGIILKELEIDYSEYWGRSVLMVHAGYGDYELM